MNKRALILALGILPGAAFAQSISSFSPGVLTGVSITPSNAGLTYLISVASNPTVTYNNVTYNVTEVFGFWALDFEDPNLAGSATTFGVWQADANTSGSGAILGWKTNPNQGILPNASQSFTFDSLDVADVDNFGFHVRIDGTFPFGGNTGYITAVPEPTSMAALGIGAIAFLRRRRK